jgi:membrane associated rhomboid family serine protease
LRVDGFDADRPVPGKPSPSPAAGAAAPQTSTPLRATPALAVLCAAVWVASRVFQTSDIWRHLLLQPASFSPLSMFTAPLIHLDPWHLASNLVLLALFGPPLERRLSPGLFLLLYMGAGLLAALLHLSISLYFQVGLQQYASGASGALAGLMGAYTVLYAEAQGPRPVRGLPRSWLLLLVVAWIFSELLQGSINLMNGVEDVAHWAHIGGFLFGLIITVAMGQGTGAADQLLTDGQQMLRKGQYQEAERVLERAWSLQPHDPATILSLARAKQAMGAGETARELLAAAVEQEARDGQVERVLALYREARTLAPRLRLSSEALYRIGGWLGERGAWAEAAGALERAGSMTAATLPGGDDALAATALYRAAEISLTRLGQPERAVTLLERLLHEHPESQWRSLVERTLRDLSTPEQKDQHGDTETRRE